MSDTRIAGAVTLNELLPHARQGGYAVAAFNPRYRACIRPVFEAAMATHSPVIIEISQRELGWFQLSPAEFREEVAAALVDLRVDVPFTLHLDHTWTPELIDEAIDAGFSSVMIDSSTEPFERNLAITRDIAKRAHARGVSVEAELGRLTTTDRMETDYDEQMYTDPAEARSFVESTKCDALAVSVGTAHGVYPVKNPTIDFVRLTSIRHAAPNVAIVLHGGSGLPTATVHRAIALQGGGISKLNIATDLEQALLAAMGGLTRMTSAELDQLDHSLRERGLDAVRNVARDKIEHFVRSAGRA